MFIIDFDYCLVKRIARLLNEYRPTHIIFGTIEVYLLLLYTCSDGTQWLWSPSIMRHLKIVTIVCQISSTNYKQCFWETKCPFICSGYVLHTTIIKISTIQKSIVRNRFQREQNVWIIFTVPPTSYHLHTSKLERPIYIIDSNEINSKEERHN